MTHNLYKNIPQMTWQQSSLMDILSWARLPHGILFEVCELSHFKVI